MQFEKDIPYDSTSAEPFFERMGLVDELQQCRHIIDSTILWLLILGSFFACDIS